MAKTPTSVQIRTYQVGFGDCFLLSFVYGDKDTRHVLIDFGTTELPKRGAPITPSAYMPTIAEDIKTRSGGHLTAVVATHRHADHISGFATDGASGGSGKTIASLKPEIVLQPWTEDPKAARDAKKATADSSRSRMTFTGGLAAMQDIAQAVYDLASRPPSWMGPALQRELAFIGLDNIANESAVSNLIEMGGATTAVWAHHGSEAGLDGLLPGVKVRVFGPPDLTQTEGIRRMRKTDPDQFWHLLAGSENSGAVARGIKARGTTQRGSRLPAEARWFRDRLDRMRGEQLLQIVRTLDDQMNNTSVILLFEVFGKKLLFPGDAQIENWSWALQDAPDAEATRKLLAGVDVYKVGHHGSLNATPKALLWHNFQKRNDSGKERLHTLLSTLPGKHGKVRSGTEVPRKPLLEALQSETVLQNTDDLSMAKGSDISFLLEVSP
jgi:hypothetical protein